MVVLAPDEAGVAGAIAIPVGAKDAPEGAAKRPLALAVIYGAHLSRLDEEVRIVVEADDVSAVGSCWEL